MFCRFCGKHIVGQPYVRRDRLFCNKECERHEYWCQPPNLPRYEKLLLALTIAIFIIIGLSVAAWGRDPTGKWANSPYHAWFITQLQEEAPISCCGEGDAHETQVKVENGTYFVTVEGHWLPYPKKVNPYHENETGKNWVWYAGNYPNMVFYCLRLATGT